MKILVLINGQNGCDYHRMLLPFKYLPIKDGETMMVVDTFIQEGIPVNHLKDADIVAFSRTPFIGNTSMEWFRKKYGFKVWCDIDDYWELYKDHYLYDQYRRTQATLSMQNSMRLADIVTCTNDRLAEKIKAFNKRVEVVPNGVPFGYDQFSPKRTERTLTRFMYVGGQSHYNDLNSIREVFRKCRQMNEISSKSEFIMAGYNTNSPQMQRMAAIMSCSRNFKTRPELPVRSYMEHYNNTDIALAPLQDNEFNTYKSNLKIIEAGAMGIPIIVSKMYPFLQDSTAMNRGVLFCNSVQSWVDAIKMFIDEPNKISELGQSLYEYVKQEYDLLKINEKRRQIITYLNKLP